jgi:hypothetical protein
MQRERPTHVTYVDRKMVEHVVYILVFFVYSRASGTGWVLWPAIGTLDY